MSVASLLIYFISAFSVVNSSVYFSCILTLEISSLTFSISKIKTRISWSEANQIVIAASRRLKTKNIRFAFAGSWARKEETCGDLDLLVLEKDKELVRKLLKDIKGSERIEIYGSKRDDWESQLLYLYGSSTFNILMRSLAKRKGYLLSQYGLFDRKTNQRITTNEKKIFKLLGLDWIPPEQRKMKKKPQDFTD